MHAEHDAPRRTCDDLAPPAWRDDDLAPRAWRAFGGDVEAFVGLSPRAQYALSRVEDEARENPTRHTWATFRPRFVTAMRATRGLTPAYDEAGNRVRSGRPRLSFGADGGIYSSADRHTPFLDADDSESGASLMLAYGAAQAGDDDSPEALAIRLEAALDGEREERKAPQPSRLVPMTAAMRALRVHIEEQISRGHVPCWRSWALRILALRGAFGHGCIDDDLEGELDEPTPRLPRELREFLAAVERRMVEPAPKRAGQSKAWVRAAGHLLSERGRAALAREDEAKALATKCFGLLGVACQRGSSAEKKRADRSAEAAEFAAITVEAFDAAEAGDTSTAVELWAERQRTLSGEPYTPAGTTRQRPL
jgi:hypothetical protein